VSEIVFAIPGDLRSPTGGYAYARRLLRHLPEHGVEVRHLALPGGFPDPSADDLAETARLIDGTGPASVLLIDGLAYGAMPVGLIAGFKRPVVALVHHPLGLENGLPPVRQAELIASEAQALALAHHVIVTSRMTARLLRATLNVPPEKISVAEPGTEPAARARGTGSPVRILSVGTVSPRKGYDLLVAALGPLRDLDWQLTIAGATDRVPGAAQALERSIRTAGIESRVELAGAVDERSLDSLYDRADVFVSASLFEGYGMALAEALVRGLPMVVSTGGAAVETVPDEAALKVPPGDVQALGEALRGTIGDSRLRSSLAEAAWRAGQTLPRWTDTARHVAHVLRQVTP
jgi:glycosyltransferase involved in cell wall biosynthesis